MGSLLSPEPTTDQFIAAIAAKEPVYAELMTALAPKEAETFAERLWAELEPLGYTRNQESNRCASAPNIKSVTTFCSGLYGHIRISHFDDSTEFIASGMPVDSLSAFASAFAALSRLAAPKAVCQTCEGEGVVYVLPGGRVLSPSQWNGEDLVDECDCPECHPDKDSGL